MARSRTSIQLYIAGKGRLGNASIGKYNKQDDLTQMLVIISKGSSPEEAKNLVSMIIFN